MHKLTLKSYAKLNLYLAVLNKRKDNYHNLDTLFERISLFDRIILESRRDKKIKIICSHPEVPKDNSNLAYKSAKLLQDSFGVCQGVNIRINKKIPVAAGLGGGSSNAAAMLLGLNKLWNLGLAGKKIVSLAQKIGSDVPFFIYNSAFAEGRGRGDKIKILPALKTSRLWHILVVPKIKVSTPFIYKKWDKKAGLTKPPRNVKILTLALAKHDLSLTAKALYNSLEEITLKLYPQVKRIKEKFMQLGLNSVLMSGSGPAVFAVVSSRKEALAFSRKFRKGRLGKVFVVRTA